MAQAIAAFRYRPKISIVTPVYNTPVELLNLAIQSVLRQHYGNWELCICDDASPNVQVRTRLMDWEKQDARIKVTYSRENEGISRASNHALALATGEFVGLLDHDDELSPDALFEVAMLLQGHPGSDMIYSDEDRLDSQRRRTAHTGEYGIGMLMLDPKTGGRGIFLSRSRAANDPTSHSRWAIFLVGKVHLSTELWGKIPVGCTRIRS
jgi:glycosyltransferase involved in cell wall biosynthesis